jgi:hypothetical protein
MGCYETNRILNEIKEEFDQVNVNKDYILPFSVKRKVSKEDPEA